MTPDDFRRLALTLPETAESAHMGHPDFRVRGKIFATLGYPSDAWGMVKLTPLQQQRFTAEHPDVFAPVRGGWGRRGATSVRLRPARMPAVRQALLDAWANTAPRRVVRRFLSPDRTSNPGAE